MTDKTINCDFSTMSKGDALTYCYTHENEYKADVYGGGEDGTRMFDCLVDSVESGHIKPSELPDYGMNFE